MNIENIISFQDEEEDDDIDNAWLEYEEEIFKWVEYAIAENNDEYFCSLKRNELYEEICDALQLSFIHLLDEEVIANVNECAPPSIIDLQALQLFVRQRINLYFEEFYVENIVLNLQKINDELPKQRTPEWYLYRHNLLTASNIYKIFGSSSQLNSLILEKCQTVKQNFSSSSCEWGKLFEPLSILLYERKYDTKVKEFGCIPHPIWKCLGASPDGICIGKHRYGRMLEIKNIFNRVITGTPLPHYWIQMQIQMEVCNLESCDFLETRFKQCSNVDEWLKVSNKSKGCIYSLTAADSSERVEEDPCVEKTEITHEYKVFEMVKDDDAAQSSEMHLTHPTMLVDEFVGMYSSFANVRWWYLDEWSCVKIVRDRNWFCLALPKIMETWDIILQERVNGFEHRRPKSRGVLFLY